MSNKKKFLTGAFILSIASLIAKMLSAVYKIPFQNLTGNQGFYVYQQIYPFYGLSVAFSLTGFPMVISKIISEAKDEKELKNNLSHLFSWLALFSIVLFIGLQVFSSQIAQLMGDIYLTSIIESVSFVFLFLPFLSILRGYFQGNMDMKPTAVSQTVEQVIRVFVLLMTAYLFTQSTWNVYDMGERAMHSSWFAALFGSGVMLYYIFRNYSIKSVLPHKNALFSKKLGKRLFKEGLEITAVSSLMILFQFIDSFTVYNGLVNSGYPEEISMGLKGIYDRGQPFVQLGLVASISFATSLLPVMRKNFKENNLLEWKYNAVSVLRLTIVFSAAATVGLIAIMPWLNHALFSDFEGIRILQIYVLSVLFASLIISCQAIIQSTDLESNTLFALFVGLVFKFTLNEFIVQRLGLIGSSTVTVMSLVFIFLILSFQLPKSIWEELTKNHFIFKLLMNLMILYAMVYGGISVVQIVIGVPNRLSSFLLALLGVSIGVLIYLFFALRWNLLTRYETKQLPFSNWLRKLEK